MEVSSFVVDPEPMTTAEEQRLRAAWLNNLIEKVQWVEKHSYDYIKLEEDFHLKVKGDRVYRLAQELHIMMIDFIRSYQERNGDNE